VGKGVGEGVGKRPVGEEVGEAVGDVGDGVGKVVGSGVGEVVGACTQTHRRAPSGLRETRPLGVSGQDRRGARRAYGWDRDVPLWV
jgi:hypothetical protein